MPNSQLPPEHAIVRCTVRILAGIDACSLNSVGTGFFYKVVHPTTNLAKILVVTNKHVVRGAQVVQLVISSAQELSELDQHGQPVGRRDDVINWMLTKGEEYTDHGQAYYDERHRERVVHNLNKRANELGMQLVPCANPA
jgi:hypothetical protein